MKYTNTKWWIHERKLKYKNANSNKHAQIEHTRTNWIYTHKINTHAQLNPSFRESLFAGKKWKNLQLSKGLVAFWLISNKYLKQKQVESCLFINGKCSFTVLQTGSIVKVVYYYYVYIINFDTFFKGWLDIKWMIYMQCYSIHIACNTYNSPPIFYKGGRDSFRSPPQKKNYCI
jgi:hypothetical protein